MKVHVRVHNEKTGEEVADMTFVEATLTAFASTGLKMMLTTPDNVITLRRVVEE